MARGRWRHLVWLFLKKFFRTSVSSLWYYDYLYIGELRAWRLEPSHWLGSLFTYLFNHIHFILELSIWKLLFFIGLTILSWHLDGSHVEWLQQAFSHSWQAQSQNPELPPRGSLGMLIAWALILGKTPWVWAYRLPSILWLSWMLLCWVSSLPCNLTLSMATLHLLKLWELEDCWNSH